MHDSQGKTKPESSTITLSQPLKESSRVCPPLWWAKTKSKTHEIKVKA
jgi:hypothetical protein